MTPHSSPLTPHSGSVPRGARIYVAGHRGLVGSALTRRLTAEGYTNLITRSHAELDLTDQPAVQAFFARERPDYVFLAAAKVGGILANDTYPAEFIRDNLAIQTHVIHEAWRAGVKRLLFLGSSCIYPRDCPQPMKEDYLLTGPLESTNRPYAVAKIAGIEMCWAYNRQYGTQYLAAMPTNLYGPGDNFDLEKSHVLPALIRKMHEAKLAAQSSVPGPKEAMKNCSLSHRERGRVRGYDKEINHCTPSSQPGGIDQSIPKPCVCVWGTGTPRREFLHSDDMADACLFLMNLPDDRFASLLTPHASPLINIGTGTDQTIRELAELVRDVVGFDGELEFDTGKPDGTPRKLLDVSRLHALGWRARIGLREGIAGAYRWYLEHEQQFRAAG